MTAYTPNLPALLDALPSDATRAPQESCAADSTPAGCCPQCATPVGPSAPLRVPGAEPVPNSADAGAFTRARQLAFLENLSVTGSVRSAASAAQVSHQTAYRARRAEAHFRLAWDAALVVARANAADVLACRAIEGTEEKVFYHGEEVAVRTRYSDRLLLAHLGRLDRMAETPQAAAFAQDWDAAVARFERGEAQPAPGPEFFAPGPCNTRSMSRVEAPVEGSAEPPAQASPPPVAAPVAPPPDADEWRWEHFDREEIEAACAGETAREAKLPPVERLLAAMERQRPRSAPRLPQQMHGKRVEDWQLEAFLEGIEDWWAVVPPPPGADEDEWHFAALPN